MLRASVIIPTRNKARYLALTIASLARQTELRSCEVVIVDDGSEDATREVVAAARADLALTYIRRAHQGLVIDANGDVHYCINSRSIGNLHERAASEIYYDPANLAFRRQVIEEVCSTCQVSCFVGVGLRKTVFPFVRFTVEEGSRRLIARRRAPRIGRPSPRGEPAGLVGSADSER